MSSRAGRLACIAIAGLGLLAQLACADAPVTVAVYMGSSPSPYGAQGMYDALLGAPGISPVRLETLNPLELTQYPVLVMGSAEGLGGADMALPYERILQHYVDQGGGLVLTHFSTGFVKGHRKAFNAPLFPNVAKPVGKVDALTMKPVKDAHPIVKGLPSVIDHAYVDHVQLEAGPDGTVLATDDQGKAVAVAGAHGKGRVLLLGNLVGHAAKERKLKAYAGEDRAPEGGELALLVNGLQWLAGADSANLRTPETLASFAGIAGMPHSSPGQEEAIAKGCVIVPEPQEIALLGGRCPLTEDIALVITGAAKERGDYLGLDMLNARLAKRHAFTLKPTTEAPPSGPRILIGNPEESAAIAALCKDWDVAAPDNEEGYALVVRDGTVLIAARTAKGACYGVQSLIQLLRRDAHGTHVPNVAIRDWPDCPVRGMLVALNGGGPSVVEYAKKLVQLLVHLKANTVVFMARKIAYDDMPEFQRRMLRGLDRESAWTFDDLAEVADEAHRLGLNVIPGTVSLGHSLSDRLALSTPEIAEYIELNEKGERRREHGEDCFCWSSPKVKELFRKHTDALIRATRPEDAIHLMTDEIYHFGICPRCKGKNQAELFADYVKTMHAQAARHGLRTWMWPDLLLEHNAPTTLGATGFHGWRNVRTGPAIDLIPRDIVMNPWYYGPAKERPVYQHLTDKGFPLVACPGGTGPPPRYSKAGSYYAAIEGRKVGFLGNVGFAWGLRYQYPRSLIHEPMEQSWTVGRPLAQAHEDDDLAIIQDLVFLKPKPAMQPGRESFPVNFKSLCNTGFVHKKGKGGWFRYGPHRDFRDFKPEEVKYEEVVFDLPETGAPKACLVLGGADELKKLRYAAAGVNGIPVKRKAASLVFLHTCMLKRNALDREIARYTVHYADGGSVTVPIRFGKQVAGWLQSGISTRDYAGWQLGPGYLSDAALAYHGENERGERMMLHAFEWVNPYPAREIESVDVAVTSHDTGTRFALLALSGVEPTAQEIASSPQPPDVPSGIDGLVSYWPLDEGQGDRAGDLMGRNPARIKGAAWSDGITGKALSFDGTGQYVDLGSDESLLFDDSDFTYEFWLKTDCRAPARVIGRFARCGGSGGAFIRLLESGQARFYMHADDKKNPQSVTSKTDLADGKWHHVVAVRQGPTASLYVDGALEQRTEYDQTCLVGRGISTYLGTEWVGDRETYKGLIDEVRVYRRALAPEEIKANHDAAISP